MKKNITSFLITLLVFTVVTIGFTINSDSGNYSVYASSSSSPGAKTGSPADGNNCTQCHAGTINSGTATTTITAPSLSGGYVPGQTYTISAAITGAVSTKIGFEITAENSSNAKSGILIITDPTRTRTVNAGKAVTHNGNAGSSAVSNSNAWSFDWTAPTVGTGTVTFYANFNATNSNGSTSGDQVYSKTFVVTENISTSVVENNTDLTIKLYPNPATSKIQINSVTKINSVEIYNLKGQLVLASNFTNKVLDVENLPTGMYFVKVNTNESQEIIRLIKE